MASKNGEPPFGGSDTFSTGEPTDGSRAIAAVVELRDVATVDERIEALIGGAT